ncbi:Ribosomal RNA-processing protein 12 [Golovinomyces cichoracearum]|uniref:Ribosomal RNA-processing protein 12 n=1 Tax=Golovinomyces cichoracearum TaxID=62708 RepID=A0A420IRW3_9PEZI|nr:Ribosomal RNA-processing protein 12 [Golovinomyces cichoracearum]
MTLEEKLLKIRSPRLQSQQSTQIVLSAIEDTFRDQETEATPAGYFAALLSLLRQAISNTDVNKDLATSVVYLLDVVTPYTPQALLRSKFSQILTNLAPALTFPEADAPLLRPSIGCLESLLVAQDSAAWDMGRAQIGPRQALAGLLVLAADHRPKIRKRAQDAVAYILKNPPLSVAVDHPAADMCAETALKKLSDLASKSAQGKREQRGLSFENEPSLIHALHMVKTVATASGGWPVRKIESLCEVLLNISKSSNHFLTMAVLNVFDVTFESMASAETSSKLPRLLEVISELQPSQNDSQLLPPWIAVISRGYSVSAKVEPVDTFQKLPVLFATISGYLSSSSHDIRVSASECLISFMENCVPESVIQEPSIYDEKIFEKIGKAALDLLSVKYQAAWPQTFSVIGSIFKSLRHRAESVLLDALKLIGDLRENNSFNGKKEADEVIGNAIQAVGPEVVLNILPLNLTNHKTGQPGRAWLLPLLRDNICNTNLRHFKSVFVPLSETIFQRVINHNGAEKTMEIKIFETVVQQIWALLPGYCDLPLDLMESFDQAFAEIVSNLLYTQIDLRSDICKALQNLVESNKAVVSIEGGENSLKQNRITKAIAQKNLEYLSNFASNMLAVLFNVYSQTLPQFRGYILQCINAYLSITPAKGVKETFERINVMLEASIKEIDAKIPAEKQTQNQKNMTNSLPPTSHTLMDLVVAISVYLPRECFQALFSLATLALQQNDDPQLQKKAYKIIPRLSKAAIGQLAIKERSHELQDIIISSSETVCASAKKDRLAAISALIPSLPSDSLHFIPAVLSEVVISCKETNEKARTTAFDLLILMGEKIRNSSNVLIENKKITHMPNDAPSVFASLEEYFTMVSAGLAGSTPHTQSACVTALTRIMYHFHEQLSTKTILELIETMNIYLASNNREIVRSVLGFVKCCVISLPTDLMQPRLSTLIPSLMVWSHEHKGQFKAKVKHIIERMIRRFGLEQVNKNCPADDRKLITNIHKTKERNKRHKALQATKNAGDESVDKELESNKKKQGRFESEYEAAVQDSDTSSTESDVSENELIGKKNIRSKSKSKAYIVEDAEEPLDLLDRKALANISSVKPMKQKSQIKSKVKINLDGKILLEDSDNDAMLLDTPENGDDEGGIDAYVKAIKGRDAASRGRNGRLKFSNKRDENEENEMDLDQNETKLVRNQINQSTRNGSKVKNNMGKISKMGVKIQNGRRGLGEKKTRGEHSQSGRVMKSSSSRRGLR